MEARSSIAEEVRRRKPEQNPQQNQTDWEPEDWKPLLARKSEEKNQHQLKTDLKEMSIGSDSAQHVISIQAKEEHLLRHIVAKLGY